MATASNVVAEPSKAAAEGYRSIAFESGAPHEKYFGWTELVVEPGLKIIRRQHGPVRRCLILAQGIPSARLDEIVRRYCPIDKRTDLMLHDFDDLGRDERVVAGLRWRLTRDDDRILNNVTIVVDVMRDDATLISAMTADCRRKLRKAREANLRVYIDDHPANETLREFIATFEVMAHERELRSPGRGALQRMFDGGNLTLFRTVCGEQLRSAATIYCVGDKGIFMIGVGGDRRNDGAGQLLHFEIMRELRARGLRWYDLGGVASTDNDDGIYRFKKGFGGALVSLGAEYICRPLLVRALVQIKRLVMIGS